MFMMCNIINYLRSILNNYYYGHVSTWSEWLKNVLIIYYETFIFDKQAPTGHSCRQEKTSLPCPIMPTVSTVPIFIIRPNGKSMKSLR